MASNSSNDDGCESVRLEDTKNNDDSSSSKQSFFCAIGSETTSLSDDDLRTQIYAFLDSVAGRHKIRDDVLLLPPDYTRYHSHAGQITQIICNYFHFTNNSNTSTKDNDSTTNNNDDDPKPPPTKIAKTDEDVDGNESISVPTIEILPALGTHAPMTEEEIRKMFGPELAAMDPTPFRVHDWRNDIVTIGQVPAAMVSDATNGMIANQTWPAQLNKIVWNRRIPSTNERNNDDPPVPAESNPPKAPSLIISIGQVVPHEVMGMANFNKNLFIGTGGTDAINLSHFIGAVIGMERVMGRKSNALRDILNHASDQFLHNQLDLWYILTVIGADPDTGKLVVRGLYIGNDIECYLQACDLSLKVNFTLLDKPVHRMVVYLDPESYHSTWLGNKAIYRTRMAMADNGELIILAPGIKRFGEDTAVDVLIRKYGYKGTPYIMQMMEQNEELKESLSAVAHLIHGSSEGRFNITYCPGKYLTKDDIEQVGFLYNDFDVVQKQYDIQNLKDGWNHDDFGDFFYISNPSLGLWATKSRFFDEKESIEAK